MKGWLFARLNNIQLFIKVFSDLCYLIFDQAYVEIARRYGISPVALAIGKYSALLLHFYVIINITLNIKSSECRKLVRVGN